MGAQVTIVVFDNDVELFVSSVVLVILFEDVIVSVILVVLVCWVVFDV